VSRLLIVVFGLYRTGFSPVTGKGKSNANCNIVFTND
jgi:hypothetical protein